MKEAKSRKGFLEPSRGRSAIRISTDNECAPIGLEIMLILKKGVSISFLLLGDNDRRYQRIHDQTMGSKMMLHGIEELEAESGAIGFGGPCSHSKKSIKQASCHEV